MSGVRCRVPQVGSVLDAFVEGAPDRRGPLLVRGTSGSTDGRCRNYYWVVNSQAVLTTRNMGNKILGDYLNGNLDCK